jgi:hypothetical protein
MKKKKKPNKLKRRSWSVRPFFNWIP